jgi:hypothetical protein
MGVLGIWCKVSLEDRLAPALGEVIDQIEATRKANACGGFGPLDWDVKATTAALVNGRKLLEEFRTRNWGKVS